MGRLIAFTVDATPVTQGSGKAILSKATGRPIWKPEHEADLKAWREQVAWAAKAEVIGRSGYPIDAPVWLTVTFRLARPKRTKFGDWPAGKPDASKLLRAVEDAMTGVIYADDARIVACTVEKVWAWEGGGPGCTITVETLADRMESVFGGGGA